MRHHKGLSAEQVRRMPWRTQVGMVASELSRINGLLGQGGGDEIQGCLDRARELLGVLESVPLPVGAGVALRELAHNLAGAKLGVSQAWTREQYDRLMTLYQS